MHDDWSSLESALRAQEPRLLAALNAPARPDEIRAVEEAIGVQFPATLRAAYERHNGTADDEPQFFAYGFRWPTLDVLLSRWQGLQRNLESLKASDSDLFPDEDESWDSLAVKPFLYHRPWLPVGLSGTESLLLCDADPGVTGHSGRLIRDGGLGVFEVIDEGFDVYVRRFASVLERGLLRWGDGLWEQVSTGQPVFWSVWNDMHGIPTVR